jgi:hypothetical protein
MGSTSLRMSWLDSMILRERFILTYAITVLGTAVIFSSMKLFALEVHFAVYVIEFLVVLEFFASRTKSLSRVFAPVAITFFLGFLYIVANGVIRILTTTH